MKRHLAIGVFVALVVAASIAARSGIDVRGETARFVESLREQGDVGVVWFGLSYVPASVLFLPASWLTLLGGFTFGVGKALIAISLGSTVGATAAFYAGRTFLRHFIEDRIAGDLRFRMLDQAVADQGFKIVMLTRLSPILPFNLLNYAFGLTRVRPRDFILASWIGMFPGTLLFVSIGAAAKSISDILAGRTEGGLGLKIFLGVGVAATLLATIVLSRIAKKALAAATLEKAATPDSEFRQEPA